MTDIKIGSGKVKSWESGDRFKIRMDDQSNMNAAWVEFRMSPEESEERSAILRALADNTVVEIVVRVTNKPSSGDLPGQTKLVVE